MIGKMGTAVGLPSIELSLLFFELAPDWARLWIKILLPRATRVASMSGCSGPKTCFISGSSAAYWSRMAAASLAGSRD